MMPVVTGPNHKTPGFFRRHVLYPTQYTWFVFVSAVDLMFTWLILSPAIGGREVNSLANTIIQRYGLAGLATYKFALVAFVVLMCEVIGRSRPRMGRGLAGWAVALPAIAVVWSGVLLVVARTRVIE